MKTNNKSNIWLYAVILFTSAFLVLLFAAYSQIRMNQDLKDYKSQFIDTETEKNKYLRSFSTAQEMNEALSKEIQMLEEENEALKEKINELTDANAKLEETLKLKQEACSGLANAIDLYCDGDVIGAAEQFMIVDLDKLDDKLAQTSRKFEKRVRKEAGNVLFNEGISLYGKGNYTGAVEKLSISFRYAPKEEFSDKCLYFLGYAEYRTGDKASALKHMKQLLQEYPESNYIQRARQFVDKHDS